MDSCGLIPYHDLWRFGKDGIREVGDDSQSGEDLTHGFVLLSLDFPPELLEEFSCQVVGRLPQEFWHDDSVVVEVVRARDAHVFVKQKVEGHGCPVETVDGGGGSEKQGSSYAEFGLAVVWVFQCEDAVTAVCRGDGALRIGRFEVDAFPDKFGAGPEVIGVRASF